VVTVSHITHQESVVLKLVLVGLSIIIPPDPKHQFKSCSENLEFSAKGANQAHPTFSSQATCCMWRHSLVKVFMIKTKLTCKSAYICLFPFRFYLTKMCIIF